MPEIVAPHCWGHQVALLLGDYLKFERTSMQIVDQAIEIIKWFNNHSVALGLFRVEELQVLGKMLALLLPVVSRWTSHYVSVARLLEVQKPMRVCVLKSREALLTCAGTDANSAAKANEVLETVGRDQFWATLKVYAVVSL